MTLIPNEQNLFIVDLHYTVPFDQVEPHLDAHMDFIKDLLGKGFIVAAGRKNPRTGGVIIATAPSLSDVTETMEQDPFHTADVVEFTYTEFVPSTRHPEFG